MKVIAGGRFLYHLRFLLEFLAAWENRPVYLTPMAYRWCSAISEAAGRLEMPTRNSQYMRLRTPSVPSWIETDFPNVGPGLDPLRPDTTSHRVHGYPQLPHPHIYAYLLSITLDIGFRRATPSSDRPILHLDQTSHHEWMFETAFSSGDEVIADAVSMWIVGGDSIPPSSCAYYFAKRVENETPFSQRLQQLSLRVIDRIWGDGSETVRWLNRLNIDADDLVEKRRLARLLVAVIRSPTGPESLSSHCWHLLDKLVVTLKLNMSLVSRDTEVMRSLERAEDWEKLGAWMVVVWSFSPYSGIPKSESMDSIEQVTLKSLLRQPSALSRFEDLCDAGTLSLSHSAFMECKAKLRRICDHARAERFPLEPPPPP